MPKPTQQGQQIWTQNNFLGGIQSYPKTSTIKNGFYFGRSINYRDDPQAITLQPGAVKESGSVVTDLIKWGDLLPSTFDSYFLGDTGNIYHRDNTGSWSNLHQAAGSHGNGLSYFFADDYLYYANDANIGRYGPVSGSSPQFSDNFLKAQGGVPLNTNSMLFTAASSMYATAADSASLSVTGDLTLETYFKANTLPAVGSSMTLIGKWDESGATRSYKLDLYGVSGYFGDGSDGSLTISSNTTDSPIDSACTGTSGTQSLTATNASFAVGQIILIHQTQGTNAGQYERNTIQGYTAGTITLQTPLKNTYTTGAQVRTLPQYTNVTVDSGVTYTVKAWNGTTGGILDFLANGTVTLNGTIAGDSLGFRGGAHNSYGINSYGYQGESAVSTGSTSSSANGGGGGGGQSTSQDYVTGGGGGGGYTLGATAGTSGQNSLTGGNAGQANGSADLTTLNLGSGGGAGGSGANYNDIGATGGTGGAAIIINSVTFTMGSTGLISSNGANGVQDSQGNGGGGGGASGGAVRINCQTATLGTNQISVTGGTGSTQGRGGTTGLGGNGAVGRLDINYLTSYTGTTTPTINVIQDNTLVTTTTIQARLGISNDGTNFEYLTQNLNNLTTGTWNRLSVAWTASTSTAQFYLNAVFMGTSTGTKTAISDNTSLLYISANKNATAATNFFDGLQDDVRIWNNIQTAGDIFANNDIQINAASAGLEAYYKFNGDATDATSNANNLTLVNTPTYSTDVPFPDPTTRLDIDTQATGIGQTYTLATSISETATQMLSFTPVNDPQASIGFFVSAKGTGNWTVTIHDQQNKVIATQTIANASVPAGGEIEFIFTTPWRIVIGKTYHAHLTSTVADGIVVTSTASDFSTAEYATYFGFLVTDTDFHPILPFLNFEAIGNERYIAVWDGAFYYPNKIAFPTGWRVRALSTWREFMAIGVWRGPDITSYTHGRVYFWDGIAPTFNFFIDVPDGQINALWGRDSDLFIVAGYRGDLLDYQGTFFFDTGNSKSVKVRFLPKRSPSGHIEVYPGAMNYYRNLTQIGFAASSTMTTIEKGVYSYGTYDPQMPHTVSFDYPISTGNRGSTVSIGCVFPIGDKMIIGWQDGSAYGADVIDYDNPPASSGRIELMINDLDVIWHDKTNYQIKADLLPLQSGESVDVAINLDRAGWTTSQINSTVGDNSVKMYTTPGRAREIQFAADLYTTGSTSPTLLGISAILDPLSEELQF